MTRPSVRVRRAVAGDEREILRMIVALATFERAGEAVEATEESLAALMFGDDPNVFADIAEVDGRAVGLAVWFLNFSTWTGRHGVYLEDLFVDPDARRQGVAQALFGALAQEAARRGCARIDCAVLDWNRSAMDFYESLGARRSEGWQPWRLDGAALAALAAG
ncbi:MAG: N-acetyltransferase [Sphingomonas bacterium]|nr:N-acetyltransferase [Sphingomonas bacterium]